MTEDNFVEKIEQLIRGEEARAARPDAEPAKPLPVDAPSRAMTLARSAARVYNGKQIIAVRPLTAIISEAFDKAYTTHGRAEDGSQTPLYAAARRGLINTSESPPYQTAIWIVVDETLRNYLEQLKPRETE